MTKKTLVRDPQASTMLALALSELEAAEVLVDEALTREAVPHLYGASYYASRALLAPGDADRDEHDNVARRLARAKEVPPRYIELHQSLRELQRAHTSRPTDLPGPAILERKLRVLQKYILWVDRRAAKVETLDILDWICREHDGEIRDLSYDIYCPRTYAHHTRLTFWQPPFYRETYSTDQLANHARRMLGSLRVRRVDDYVVGLNSRLDQYRPLHLLLLDIDTLDAAVETELAALGGVLLKSGRGFHFIGTRLIDGQKEWAAEMRRIRRHKILGRFVDHDHIDISLQRGYATLRITASRIKPQVPVYYKTV